jgi:hypothetical protein
VSSLEDKVDKHPIYQREIRWNKEKMDALISTIMETGVVPSILLYKLQPTDDRKLASFRWECIDGQHRLFVLEHFFRSRLVRLDGREWMVSWNWVSEDKQVTHIFYQESEDTKRWIAAHPKERYEYMSEDERDFFGDFSMELREIKDPLTLEQRCAIFTSLQQGVQVRGSDLLKNFTKIQLIQFIQYEKKWESRFKDAILAHCHLKAKNYWLHWAIRCFFIQFPEENSAAHDSFKRPDVKIGQMIKANDPSLKITADQKLAFSAAMERFLSFLESLREGIRFSPAKFFGIFAHLADAANGREDILRGHMLVWATELLTKDHKTAWEKRKVGSDEDERKLLFKEAMEELARIKIPVEEMPPRKSIPKSIRERVWKNYFSVAEKGICDCCRQRIQKSAWECGHVLAAASGGKDTVDNLRPVCRTCNREMGTMHMDEFKSRYYPDAEDADLSEEGEDDELSESENEDSSESEPETEEEDE